MDFTPDGNDSARLMLLMQHPTGLGLRRYAPLEEAVNRVEECPEEWWEMGIGPEPR